MESEGVGWIAAIIIGGLAGWLALPGCAAGLSGQGRVRRDTQPAMARTPKPMARSSGVKPPKCG